MADFTFVERKPMEGREHTLIADVVIGREGCDVVLADPEVSRRHAALRHTGEGPAVEDLGSTNGTFVNGERISGTRVLSDGDVDAPPEITPSAIHRTLPESAKSAPPAFAPVGTRQMTGSAATRAGYTAFCMAVFVLTLIGVAIYFIVN